MDIETFRTYCLSKSGVTEEMPFGPGVVVYKTMGKMFALSDLEGFESINLKCEPALAAELRDRFPDAVFPGYHMNKKHWNTIKTDLISDQLIYEWTDHSYELVMAGLPARVKKQIGFSKQKQKSI
jgi:predicted DNA-binding protein (MmcQ/YjbR family)